MIGRILSHYKIVEKLGEGGMGVVWKAVDTQLQRDVAIKVLSEHVARDPEHMSRFEREAKLLASLNHRNIAAIYGLEESDGLRFLVMELVEGEDLARRLARGALPVEEAIDVGHQLARALEAAHEKGVLHRDLKPANVQVTDEGRVKVLDFGLAKAFEVESSSGDAALSPTLTSAGTRAGVILGTAAYMSPEQARGKTLDKRSDIWSFGCVLYECLTSRSAFRGETVSDTLASILKTDPDWSALPQSTPPRVRELLAHCLEKDVRNRQRDIGDARLELQRSIAGHESLSITSGVSPAGADVGRRPRRFSMPALVAAILVGAIAGAGIWSLLPGTGPSGRATPTGVQRFSVDYPRELRDNGTLLAPGGDAIVFSGSPRKSRDSEQDLSRLYVRRFDSYSAEPIEGSEGVSLFALSPDGRWVAMLTPVAPKSSKFRLSKVPLDGSAPPLVLLDWPENWGLFLWLPDGDLLVKTAEPEGLVRIPSGGGSPKAPVEIRPEGFEGTVWFGAPNASVLPDGVHVLSIAVTYAERGYVQSVALLNSQTGEARILIDNGSSPQWSPTGHLLFSRGDALLAVPFDLERLATAGEQVAITDGLRTNAIWADALFQISTDGTLLHWPGGLVGGNRRLVFLDGELNIEGPWSDERRTFEGGVVVSNDGRRLATIIVNAEGLYEIWVSDLDRPRLIQLVHESGKDCVPHLWGPDGDHLIYACSATEGNSLYRRRGDGTGEAELLISTQSFTEFYIANTFLRNGSSFIAMHVTGTESELVLMPFSPAEDVLTPVRLVANAGNARISPDGRWLTYQSDDSGRNEIYLRRIEDDGSLGPEIPASTGGGSFAIWYRRKSAAPLEIRYFNEPNVFSVTVTAGERVRISEPRLVADLSELLPKLEGFPAALPDGRTLRILRGEDEEEVREANVVLNWFSELEARSPAP